MKVLVIGSGGREHALVHTFARQGNKVYCLPGNPGTEPLCEVPDKEDRDIQAHEIERLTAFAKKYRIKLTVVGPEAPLAEGIADRFEEEGLAIFGPKKEAAALESDKTFAKAFMEKHGIPTARYQTYPNAIEALQDLDAKVELWGGVAVKASGLCGGKGVVLCKNASEIFTAKTYISENLLETQGDAPWVIEEYLEGIEISLLTFCNGKQIYPLIPAQDHKPLEDGDRGPNTGGMGAYAPAPIPFDQTLKQITASVLDPTLKGLLAEKLDYRGALYFGLMINEKGVYVLEYNCRLGDPETQAVLPLIQSRLANTLFLCSQGLTPEPLEFKENQSSVCVVMASNGYPSSPKKGQPLPSFSKALSLPATTIFHAGTKEEENGRLVVAGGRVLGVTAWRGSLEEAIEAAYQAVDALHFEGAVFRTDIGRKGVKMPQ